MSAEDREARNERIIAMHKAGVMTQVEIAAENGVDTRTVSRVLHAAGRTEPRRYTRRHPPELWEKIEAWLREEEGSYAEAARTFGVSASQTSRHFPELGWTREEAGRFAGQVSRINRAAERVTYA